MIGLAGVLGDVSGALTCSAAMPNLARRLWLVSRNSHVRKDKDGRYTLENLVGADKIDVGNYKAGIGFAYSLFANCAAEFGETELAQGLLDRLEGDLNHPTIESPTGNGATTTAGLSMLGSTNIFKARTQKFGDWAELINCPPDSAALVAPKLDSVPFPSVMVARCHAEGENGLNFVLRGPSEPKRFTLGFKDLHTDKTYRLLQVEKDNEKEVVDGIKADGEGVAKATVSVGDRTEFKLQLVA